MANPSPGPTGTAGEPSERESCKCGHDTPTTPEIDAAIEGYYKAAYDYGYFREYPQDKPGWRYCSFREHFAAAATLRKTILTALRAAAAGAAPADGPMRKGFRYAGGYWCPIHGHMATREPPTVGRCSKCAVAHPLLDDPSLEQDWRALYEEANRVGVETFDQLKRANEELAALHRGAAPGDGPTMVQVRWPWCVYTTAVGLRIKDERESYSKWLDLYDAARKMNELEVRGAAPASPAVREAWDYVDGCCRLNTFPVRSVVDDARQGCSVTDTKRLRVLLDFVAAALAAEGEPAGPTE